MVVAFFGRTSGNQREFFTGQDLLGYSLIAGILTTTIPPIVWDPPKMKQVLWRLYCRKEVHLYSLSRLEPDIENTNRGPPLYRIRLASKPLPLEDNLNGPHPQGFAEEPRAVHRSSPGMTAAIDLDCVDARHRFAVTFRMRLGQGSS